MTAELLAWCGVCVLQKLTAKVTYYSELIRRKRYAMETEYSETLATQVRDPTKEVIYSTLEGA